MPRYPKVNMENSDQVTSSSAETSAVSTVASPNVETPKPLTSSPISAFDELKQRVPPLFTQSLYVGTEGIPLSPRYVPSDYAVAWATLEGDGGIHDNLAKGYALARPEDVTRDLAEAKEKGKICLLYYSIDAEFRVRYKDVVLMITKREWYENRMRERHRRVRDEIEGYVRSVVPDALSESVSRAGTVDTLLKESPFKD